MEAIYGDSAAGLLKSTAGREIALALIDLETDEAAWVEGVSLLADTLKSSIHLSDDGAPPLIAYGPARRRGDAA